MKRVRAVHRWLGLVMVLPFVVWAVTGFLFHLKPGWGRAYDLLSSERDEPVGEQTIAGKTVTVTRLEQITTALGPLTRLRVRAEGLPPVLLVDGKTGAVRSPLTKEDALVLAEDAVGRSPHKAAYGKPMGARVDGDAVHVGYSGGPVVSVDRHSARVSQSGPDTARIDWLYKMHYLQWTGVRGLDRVLAVVGLGLILVLAGLGIVMLLPRRRAGGGGAGGAAR